MKEQTALTTALSVCEDWRARQEAHTRRASDLTKGRRFRAERAQVDPIEDFLWDYYSLKPRDLARWSPGIGVALPGDVDRPNLLASSRWARPLVLDDGRRALALDVAAFMAARGEAVRQMHHLLERTASRAGTFGCLGLHEWAMVYKGEQRHPLPLRLGQAGTDAVVEASTIVCTHFDAFRFFTPAARPLNRHPLSRGSQVAMEQPACLHANMDCLKWAVKLGPACPGELLLDAFDLAARIRRLDMAASPYDCNSLGLPPVQIETKDGRAAYVAAQRAFADEAALLRQRLLAITTGLLEEKSSPPSGGTPGNSDG